MADYIPIQNLSVDPFSATTSAAVVGGVLLAASTTGAVATAGAGSTSVIGVAGFDAASGARVTVYPKIGVHTVTCAAAVTVGNTLKAAASGQVTPWVSGTDAADLIIGTALATAASGALCTFIGR